MNRIKEFIVKKIISAKKPKWKSVDKIKVAIAVNRNFTEKRWSNLLSGSSFPDTKNWEVIYCKEKIEVYRHFKDAEICFVFGISDVMLRQVSNPKMIYFPTLGLDFLNKKAIPASLTIEQPPPLSAQAIAEYCIAMAIMLTRNLHYSFENRFAKKWKQSNIIPGSVASITQCKIGILGLGRVGKVIAENFSKLGCEVLGCDLITPENKGVLSSFYPAEKLIDFLENIDILIISLPLNESTRKIIDARAIKTLGKNKYLINVSRGEIIDESALVQALSSDNLKGAALDVFEQEPLSRNSDLYHVKNVILTPHIAGNINLFVDEIQRDFVRKALAYNKNNKDSWNK
ncbi:MAG: NAD(P)-dependent oxidoreductase [Bacteroidales bacterium]|nr:NAD(P)-dependent oxidoreductase [Bacteroidales bacterium]